MKHEVESLEREIATLRAETGRLTAHGDPPPHRSRLDRAGGPRGPGPGQAGRARPQAAAVPRAERALARVDLIPLLFFVALFFNIRASFKLALDWRGHARDHAASSATPTRASATLPSEERLEREPAAPVFLHLVPAYQEPDIAVTVRALVASRYPHGRLHVVVITKEEEERAPHPGDGGEHRRAGAPPARDAAALPAEAPLARGDAGPRPQGAPAQLGAAPRGAARDPGRGDRPAPRLRGRERRRLDPGPGHLPLDRPARARRAGEPRLPGHPALPRQLRPADDPREDLRDPAVVDLHPRVDRAAAQRGQARAAPRPADRARCPRLAWLRPPDLRALLPPLADLPGPQPVRAPRPDAVGRRLPDLGRHRGLHARLRARPARRADPGAADGGGDRPARDLRGRDPPERALVPGRARRHPVPLARRGGQSPPRSTWPSSCATSATRWWSGRSRRWSTR